MLLKFI